MRNLLLFLAACPATPTPTDEPPATAELLATVVLDADPIGVAVLGDVAVVADVGGLVPIPLATGEPGLPWVADAPLGSVTADGSWIYASQRTAMLRFPPSLDTPLRVDVGLAWELAPLVHDPFSGDVFGRDRTDELLYRVDFGNDVFVGTLDYTPDGEAGTTGTFGSQLVVDGETGVLYVLDAGQVFVVDPAGPTVTPLALERSAESLAIDAARRRLFVALATDGSGAVVTALDLDDLTAGETVVLGNQIHRMVVDPDSGRLFANVRVSTSWTTRVYALESDLSEVPWVLELAADPVATGSSIHAWPAVGGGRLVVASPATLDGGQSRLDVYALP
ncbi:MAG: hypothetical protein H6734_04085 [Alphaproteobacteria bacterium]|nr:hypothetical protein [Alphaproteobacteria bacterium]